MKLSNKNVEIDAIVLDEQASQPSNPKDGYTAFYVKTDGIYLLQSGSSPVGPMVHDRIINLALLDTDTALAVGDNFPSFYWCCPAQLDGYTVTDVDFWLTTAGSTYSQFQIHNVTDSVNILSTPVTIDANEYTSYTAASGSVIASGSLATGDLLRFDCDVAGTGAAGCGVNIVVEKS